MNSSEPFKCEVTDFPDFTEGHPNEQMIIFPTSTAENMQLVNETITEQY